MKSPLLTVMSNAAIKAGNGLLRDFGEVDQLQVSRKGPANFVTKSDLRSEKVLVSELKKARPDFGFLLEEQGEIAGKDSSHRFIIDPLDGTSNFIHAVPYFCISIALEKREGNKSDLLAAVIYDPIHNELFCAEKGKGATVNDRRLQVSGRELLEEAMLATGSPRQAQGDAQISGQMARAAAQTGFVRYTGSSALDLAYVAAGRYDGCWFSGLKPWDAAAGLLLIQEAGGMASDLDGKPVDSYAPFFMAASKALHPRVMKVLAA